MSTDDPPQVSDSDKPLDLTELAPVGAEGTRLGGPDPMVNGIGERLQLEKPDLLVAAADLVRRCGGTNLAVGYQETPRGTEWWATATIQHHPRDPDGEPETTSGHASPERAADALARKLIEGGKCEHCQRTIRLGGDRRDRQQVCRFKRIGPEWIRGCK